MPEIRRACSQLYSSFGAQRKTASNTVRYTCILPLCVVLPPERHKERQQVKCYDKEVSPWQYTVLNAHNIYDRDTALSR